jgi:hypothetical protein
VSLKGLNGKCRLIICVILSIVAFYRFSPAKQATQFWIGIITSDRILIPFGMYKDGNWSPIWSEPYEDFVSYDSKYEDFKKYMSYEVFEEEKKKALNIISYNDIPKSWLRQDKEVPKNWHLLGLNGDKKAMSTLEPVKFQAHCVDNWGLRINYHSSYSTNTHIPKTGLALSSKQNIMRMLDVSGNNQEIKNLFPLIKENFLNKESNSTLNSQKAEFKNKIKIKKLFRNEFTINGQFFYYFEAQKTFNKTSCLNGFISKSPKDQLTLWVKEYGPHVCYGESSISNFPFGILHIKDDIFMIIQESGDEGESYAVIKVDNSGFTKVLDVSGGGC